MEGGRPFLKSWMVTVSRKAGRWVSRFSTGSWVKLSDAYWQVRFRQAAGWRERPVTEEIQIRVEVSG